ncbi:MAG: riboflavin synthase [Candidatus Omnitrophica bacterium]|nr:riboflavin synthase [Candidatus Omnitrophota bacterium]
MFTGIIREVGRLIDVVHQGRAARLRIEAPLTCPESAPGDSICVNGVCLTATAIHAEQFSADVSSETLQRTTFAAARPGDALNIEPALRPTDRLGGHIVSGHVDGVGGVEAIEEEGDFWRVAIRFPKDLSPFIAEKGSLCVDGISLTVAATTGECASFAVVPFTLQQTNLRSKSAGDPVNLEIDILARYVERLLSAGLPSHGSGLTVDTLRKYGFTSE